MAGLRRWLQDLLGPMGGGSAMRPAPRLVPTLRSDVRLVAGSLERHGWRRAVGSTLKDLERFYLTEENRRWLAEMRGPRRFIRRLGWLLKGLLLKLTPVRRMLLALALVLLVFAGPASGFEPLNLFFRVPGLGAILLLLLLMLELKDKLVARDELEAGWRVQMALLPDESPTVPGWDVWLHTRPANDVGGDLVDHLPMEGGRHALALGDVAGKALPAALLSVKLQATLRALAPRFDDLGALGEAANRIMERDGVPSRFASLVYLTVGSDTGSVRLLNAGHMPPFVVRRGNVTSLEPGSCVLGITSDATFSEQLVALGDGDLLVAYSDGISEALNVADEFFGEERLQAVLRQVSDLPAREVGARVLEAVDAFLGGERANDDISLVVLRRGSAR